MAKTPDRRARLAQALRDNLRRRKEQERQRRHDPGDAAPPAESTVDNATVEKSRRQDEELP